MFERELRAAFVAREQKRAVFLSEYLPRSTLDSQLLSGMFAELSAPHKHVLCSAGRAMDRLLIIREGLCKVRIKHEGLVQEVGEIGKGQFVGLSALGAYQVEPYTVVCNGEVQLLKLEAADARARIPQESCRHRFWICLTHFVELTYMYKDTATG